MMFVAALITLADGVPYPWYASAPQVCGLSPLDDQELGGLIMWVPGGLFCWAVVTVLFFQWAVREERADGPPRTRLPPDPPPWGTSDQWDLGLPALQLTMPPPKG